MKLLALLAGATLLAIAAACNPADSVSEAYAEARTVSFAPLWPAPAAGAQDGTVQDYY